MAIRVLIVDDSPLVRSMLRLVLSRSGEFQVVGEASDGVEAVAEVQRLRPAVVTMDVAMPTMDGLSAIGAIMRDVPTPIVVVANAEGDPDNLAMEALAAGALDAFPKPAGGFSDAAVRKLVGLLKAAAGVRVTSLHARRTAGAMPPPSSGLASAGRRAWVGIVSSTGGSRQLMGLLRTLPAEFPVPIAVVQHTGEGFTSGLATWLAGGSALRVALGRGGEAPRAGEVVVAPEGRHLTIGADGIVRLVDEPPVAGHRPSGTVLFQSLAAAFGRGAIGVVLSGIGSDGAGGVAAIEQAGGVALVEDPSSAAVDGMPTQALAATRSALIVPGSSLGLELCRLCGVKAR